MKVKELFNLQVGKPLELMNMTTQEPKVNFVARTGENNGVVACVDLLEDNQPYGKGLITVSLGGSVLSAFVQHQDFYTSFHVMVLEPKKEMTLVEKLFYCCSIMENKYKYSYGRQANKTLKDIELPDEIPEWVYNVDLKSYYKAIKTNVQHKNLELDTSNWKEFEINQLFDVTGTRTTKIDDLIETGIGSKPYVTTQATNNGVRGFYDYSTELGNVITIDSAVLGFTSYQANDFSASDHVEKLIPRFAINKYIGLFLSTIINQERYRYSYGRKFNQVKIRNTKIKLPVTIEDTPDWDYMENFIKQLPYSDKI